jgi:elongation factor Ts
MAITPEQIKTLRDTTGVSVMQCKQALEEAGGDTEKALAVLKAQGAAIAAKKSGRDLGAGAVQAYVHTTGTVGTLVELLCETDFVAKNDDFKALAYEIAMQAAATDDDIVAGDKETFLSQPYIKDPSQTVGDLITGAVQKFGERTELGRVTKYTI